MVVDVAVEHPGARIVRDQVQGLGGRGEDLDDVDPVAVLDQGDAVPMGRVKIDFGAHGDDVPADLLAEAHCVAGVVSPHQPVDPVHQVALDEAVVLGIDRGGGIFLDVCVEEEAGVLVEHLEQREELAVDPLRRTVRLGLAFPGDDDQADHPGVLARRPVDMGVVLPDDRTRIPGAGTRPFRHLPKVGEFAAPRRDHVVVLVGAKGPVRVRRPLRVLLVENPVRMDRGPKPRVVAKVDHDRVAHDPADHRPQQPQMLLLRPPRHQRPEILRISPINRLDVFPPNHPVPVPDKDLLILAEWFPRNQIIRIIPTALEFDSRKGLHARFCVIQGCWQQGSVFNANDSFAKRL